MPLCMSASEQASEATSKVSEQASETASKVSEQASETASKANEQASEVTSQVSEQAQSAAATATRAARNTAASTRDTFRSNEDREAVPSKILYVGNLFFEVTAPQLEAEFAKFGEVSNSRVVTDDRGLSKGFAYIEFANQQQADAAVASLNQRVFQGRRLSVQYHKRREAGRGQNAGLSRSGDFTRGPAKPSKTLFIGNMSYQMSDRDLNGKKSC
jgi:nucleolin